MSATRASIAALIGPRRATRASSGCSGCWKRPTSPSLPPPSWWGSHRGRQKGHWNGWWTPICWKPRVLAATACMIFCDCSPASAAPPRSPRGCAWTRWSGRCAGTSRPPPAPAASCTRPTSGARPATAMPMVSPTVVGELASALFRFLEMRGSWFDLATLNRLAVQVARRTGDLAGEAQALNDLAAAHYRLDHLDEAVTCAEQTLAIRRSLGDRLEEGQALSNLGVHYHMVGRLDEAVACYEESLAILRDVGDRSSVGRALGNLGGVRQQLGRFDEATACYEQALAIHRDVSDRYMEGATLHSMGRALHALGRQERARACWQEALLILRALGLPEAEAVQARLDAMVDDTTSATH